MEECEGEEECGNGDGIESLYHRSSELGMHSNGVRGYTGTGYKFPLAWLR